MKKALLIFLLSLSMCFSLSHSSYAQCAMCTKTAAQLGEKPAKGMNSGIIYLMTTPFLIVGVIGYRWWKNNKKAEESEQ